METMQTKESSVVETPIQEQVFVYYHTRVPRKTVVTITRDHRGCTTTKKKEIQYHNKRATFCGMILPTDEVEQVQVVIGAARPNPVYNEAFNKKRGREIAQGRAINNPIGTFTCARGEVQDTFMRICIGLYPLLNGCYIYEEKGKCLSEKVANFLKSVQQ